MGDVQLNDVGAEDDDDVGGVDECVPKHGDDVQDGD